MLLQCSVTEVNGQVFTKACAQLPCLWTTRHLVSSRHSHEGCIAGPGVQGVGTSDDASAAELLSLLVASSPGLVQRARKRSREPDSGRPTVRQDLRRRSDSRCLRPLPSALICICIPGSAPRAALRQNECNYHLWVSSTQHGRAQTASAGLLPLILWGLLCWEQTLQERLAQEAAVAPERCRRPRRSVCQNLKVCPE